MWWNMKKEFAVVGIAFALVGCAAVEPAVNGKSPQSVEQQVIARAETRWKALIAKDLGAAYTFLSPGSKSSNPESMFKAKIRPLEWKSAVGISADCAEDQCRVKLRISLNDKRLGGDVETVVEEAWLRSSGQWWLVFTH